MQLAQTCEQELRTDEEPMMTTGICVPQKVTHEEAASGKETPCDFAHMLLNLHTPRFKTALNNGVHILFFTALQAK